MNIARLLPRLCCNLPNYFPDWETCRTEASRGDSVLARKGGILAGAMTRDIRPLAPDDLPELSRFLTAGFHAPPDADFAAPEVLRWKYLGPDAGGDATDSAPARSYIARDESGRIVGHLGLCRTAFEGQALAAAGGRVPTIHIIDWLGSPEHRPSA